MHNPIPAYLKEYETKYAQAPRGAAIEWFKEARFGLFMHYGLYSLLGRGEWVQHAEKIPVTEYAKLKDDFTAEKFDADFITDLALAAGMKYVNITTKHHDGFCLFETKTTDFSSVNSPAKRDLVAELAQACDAKGLGLFLYYSHGREWKHPHAPNNDQWRQARPEYDPPEPSYKYGEEHDLNIYLEFMHEQLKELLTQYGPVAGIWLDGWFTPASGDISKWRLSESYKLIRKLQPQTLISYKWGIGEEDFRAPELSWLKENPPEANDRPIEICHHLGGWGYWEKAQGKHRGVDDVMAMFEQMRELKANLLLNTGPLPDGSIDPDDVETLREVGKRKRPSGN